MRERIADWYVRSAGLKYTTYRTMTALSRGQQPGPEALDRQNRRRPKLQDLSAFAMELEGEAGALKGADAVGMAFSGGLDGRTGIAYRRRHRRILRNIIAERVLGLPPDMRADKDLPFNKLPTGR